MVTAETAISLGALALILVSLLWVVAVVGAQTRCVDAARDGARAAARGEPLPAIRAETTRRAPPGARVAVSFPDDRAEVEVSAPIRPPWSALAGFPAITVRATASVAVEPGLEPGLEPGTHAAVETGP